MTGRSASTEALSAFLNAVMGQKRGIPQGLPASDQLATAYLSPVDAAMIRNGFAYYRNGDDIRIAAADYRQAREAIARLEAEVRGRRLLLNSSKSKIVSRRQYDSALGDVALARATHREKLSALRERVLRDNDEELSSTLNSLGLEELGWALWYHGRATVDEVIETLREHLQPSDVDVAKVLFDEALSKQPGKANGLSPTQFHTRLVEALRILHAARSAHALMRCGELIVRYPDKTGILARYMLSLASEDSFEVVAQAEFALEKEVYRSPLEQAWLFRLLAVDPAWVSAQQLDHAGRVLADESANWLARAEAFGLLAKSGQLVHAMAVRAWSSAPEPFKADLVAAIASIPQPEPWATRFLDSAAKTPIYAVIAKHHR
jgi:hypothetical protein